MKRLIALVLLFALLLTGCSSGKQEPSDWQKQYELAVDYLSQGDYEGAILAFEAAIAIDPMQEDGYLALVRTYDRLERPDDAAETLRRGLEAVGTSKELEEALKKCETQAETEQAAEIEPDTKTEPEIDTEPERDPAKFRVEWEETEGTQEMHYGMRFICKYDEEIVWTYETDIYPVVQTPLVQQIGQSSDRWYFYEDGAIVALDLMTGEELWRSQDMELSALSGDPLIDEDGTLYAACWWHPDLYAVDKNGMTLGVINDIDETYDDPAIISKEGRTLIIGMHSSGTQGFSQEPLAIFHVNLDDYSYVNPNAPVEEPPTTAETPALAGTYWDIAFGVTAGSAYTCLFHGDGTFTGMHVSTQEYFTGSYSFGTDGMLYVTFPEVGVYNEAFAANADGTYSSVQKHEMQMTMGSYYMYLTPDLNIQRFLEKYTG